MKGSFYVNFSPQDSVKMMPSYEPKKRHVLNSPKPPRVHPHSFDYKQNTADPLWTEVSKIIMRKALWYLP